MSTDFFMHEKFSNLDLRLLSIDRNVRDRAWIGAFIDADADFFVCELRGQKCGVDFFVVGCIERHQEEDSGCRRAIR